MGKMEFVKQFILRRLANEQVCDTASRKRAANDALDAWDTYEETFS